MGNPILPIMLVRRVFHEKPLFCSDRAMTNQRLLPCYIGIVTRHDPSITSTDKRLTYCFYCVYYLTLLAIPRSMRNCSARFLFLVSGVLTWGLHAAANPGEHVFLLSAEFGPAAGFRCGFIYYNTGTSSPCINARWHHI